jgi:DNA polymerase-3 subunit delta'
VDLHALQEEARRNASWKILAERTRERLRELFLSPGMGRRRVLLILSAERLGGISGNILLKILEEPPGGAVILLLCENPSALLPTIRSRCQSCRFSPLSRALVEAFLLERGAAAPDEARLIASLSGGRIGAALELARDAAGYRSRRELLSRILLTLRRNPSAAASLAAARELVSDESETVEDLSILMDILRDAMLSGAGCPPSLLTDIRTGSTAGDPVIPAPLAANLLIRVERAREDLRRNVNRQVALESLFLDLGLSAAASPEWD